MSNSRSEKMVRTIERAIVETIQDNKIDWPNVAKPVFYKYRRRSIEKNNLLPSI